jgi:hypothetical protein
MSLTFEPIWPWLLVLPAVVALVVMVLVTYPRRVRHLPTFSRRLLIGLRLAAAIGLALAMLRPSLQFRETDQQPSILYVVTDQSRSMSANDGPNGVTRRQALLSTLEENKALLADLGDDVEIRYFDFAESLAAVDAPGAESAGEQTAIGAALQELARENQSGRLAAVLLMTDGAQRALAGFDADPRGVARRFAELHVPIYTIPYGGSGLSGSAFDVAVEDLQVDPLAFEKKTVPVNARVRVQGLAGRRLTVRLLVEDRAGKKRGEEGELKPPAADPTGKNVRPSIELEVPENQALIPVELSYVPQVPGEVKIAVEVTPLDGELLQTNNRRATIITVQQGGINVAYFDIARPEQKFIRLINRSEKIQLDFVEVKRGTFARTSDIAPEMFQRGKYDAYIIGDVPADAFGLENLKLLADRVRDGAGLLMTGGFHNFGAGGYANSPLAEILPVAMSPAERTPFNEIDKSLQHIGQLQMLPTSLGLQRFIMRLDVPEKNLERWKSLPPLNGATRLRPKNDLVEILAETPDGIPLLFAVEVGRARVAAFAGDTTRLWFSHGMQNEHQRFWRQMILWLSHKDQGDEQGIWARVDPRNYPPKQTVEVRFGARDEKGEPVADAQFQAEIKKPGGEVEKLSPQRIDSSQPAADRNADEKKHENSPPANDSEGQATADFSETTVPGDYWVRVTASRNGASFGLEGWTRFIVDARDLELDNPAADPALLEEIARVTGGYSFPPEKFAEFLKQKIKAGGLSPEMTTIRQVRLWDNWPFLLVFVAIMSIEWFVRKKKGLV